jgi:hypothetical protein
MNWLFWSVVIIIIYYLMTSTKEHYAVTDGCDCLNCGLCRTENGNIDCVYGNLYGPYFRRDCMNYTHSSRVNNLLPQFDNRYIWFWNNNRYKNRRPIHRNPNNWHTNKRPIHRNSNNWHINNQNTQLHNRQKNIAVNNRQR